MMHMSNLDIDTVGDEIVDEREGVYGDVVESMVRVADVWSGILGFQVQPAQVPLMMMGLKMVRTSITPTYSDNSDDIDGYLSMFRKIVGPDMVHARSVSEYLEKRRR